MIINHYQYFIGILEKIDRYQSIFLHISNSWWISLNKILTWILVSCWPCFNNSNLVNVAWCSSVNFSALHNEYTRMIYRYVTVSPLYLESVHKRASRPWNSMKCDGAHTCDHADVPTNQLYWFLASMIKARFQSILSQISNIHHGHGFSRGQWVD